MNVMFVGCFLCKACSWLEYCESRGWNSTFFDAGSEYTLNKEAGSDG